MIRSVPDPQAHPLPRGEEYLSRVHEPYLYIPPSDLRFGLFDRLRAEFLVGQDYSIGRAATNFSKLKAREMNEPLSEEEFHSLGLGLGFAIDWTPGMTRESYEFILDHKIREAANEILISGYRGGAVTAGLGFLSSMVGSMAHPVDLALMFLGPVPRAFPIAKQGIRGARTAHRFVEGARVSAVPSIFAETAIFAVHQEMQSNYGAEDAAMSIGMSTFASGFLGAAIGKVGDVYRSPIVRELMGRKALIDAATGSTDAKVIELLASLDPAQFERSQVTSMLRDLGEIDLDGLSEPVRAQMIEVISGLDARLIELTPKEPEIPLRQQRDTRSQHDTGSPGNERPGEPTGGVDQVPDVEGSSARSAANDDMTLVDRILAGEPLDEVLQGIDPVRSERIRGELARIDESLDGLAPDEAEMVRAGLRDLAQDSLDDPEASLTRRERLEAEGPVDENVPRTPGPITDATVDHVRSVLRSRESAYGNARRRIEELEARLKTDVSTEVRTRLQGEIADLRKSLPAQLERVRSAERELRAQLRELVRNPPIENRTKKLFNKAYARANSRTANSSSRMELAMEWVAKTLFGVELRFLEGRSLFNEVGAVLYSDPGAIYVRPSSLTNMSKVLGHELAHSLKYRDLDTWRASLDVIDKHMPELLDSYLARLRHEEGEAFLKYGEAKILDEAYASVFSDALRTPEFWRSFSETSPTLARRLYARLRRLLNQIKELLFDESNPHLSELSEIGQELGSILSRAELDGNLDPAWRPGEGVSARKWVSFQMDVLYGERTKRFSRHLKEDYLDRLYYGVESNEELARVHRNLDAVAAELAMESVDLVFRRGEGEFVPASREDGTTPTISLKGNNPVARFLRDREPSQRLKELESWYKRKFPNRSKEQLRAFLDGKAKELARESSLEGSDKVWGWVQDWVRSVARGGSGAASPIPYRNVPVAFDAKGNVIPWTDRAKIFNELDRVEMWKWEGGLGERIEVDDALEIRVSDDAILDSDSPIFINLEDHLLSREQRTSVESKAKALEEAKAQFVAFVNGELTPNQLVPRRIAKLGTDFLTWLGERDRFSSPAESFGRQEDLTSLEAGRALLRLWDSSRASAANERLEQARTAFYDALDAYSIATDAEVSRARMELDAAEKAAAADWQKWLHGEDIVAELEVFLGSSRRDGPEVGASIHSRLFRGKSLLEGQTELKVASVSPESSHAELAAAEKLAKDADTLRDLQAIRETLDRHRDEVGEVEGRSSLWDEEASSGALDETDSGTTVQRDRSAEELHMDQYGTGLEGLSDDLTLGERTEIYLAKGSKEAFAFAHRVFYRFRERMDGSAHRLSDDEMISDIVSVIDNVAGGQMDLALEIMTNLAARTKSPEEFPLALRDAQMLADARQDAYRRRAEAEEVQPDFSRRDQSYEDHVKETVERIQESDESSSPLKSLAEKQERQKADLEAIKKIASEEALPKLIERSGVAPHPVRFTDSPPAGESPTMVQRKYLSLYRAIQRGDRFDESWRPLLHEADAQARKNDTGFLEELEALLQFHYEADVRADIQNTRVRRRWLGILGTSGIKGLLSSLDGNFRKGSGDVGPGVLTQFQALRQKLIDPVHTSILAGGGQRAWKMDTAMIRDVFRYLEGGEPSGPGVKIIGDAIKNANDYYYYFMKSRGARIRHLDVFGMRQVWDATKLKKVSKEQFIQDILPRLDLDRTAENAGVSRSGLSAYLGRVYDDIVNGRPRDLDVTDFSEVDFSLAARHDKHRNLIFVDGNAVEVDLLYGSGDPQRALMSGLSDMARAATLLDNFGTRPQLLQREVSSILEKNRPKKLTRWRDRLDPDGSTRWNLLFDSLTGKLFRADNLVVARASGHLSKLADMAVLGGSGITASTMDPAHMVNQLQWMGASLSEASATISRSIASSILRATRASGADARAVLSGAGAGIEAVVSNAASRLGVERMGGSGWLDRFHKRFFDINGLNFWLKVGQDAMADSLQLRLGEWAKLTSLGKIEKDVLGRYGISEKDFFEHIAPTAREYDLPTLSGFRVTTDAVGKVNPGLADKLQLLFEEGMRMGVMEPGLSETAYPRWGATAGTISGSAQIFAAKYLAFPMAIQRRTYGRMLNAYGSSGLSDLYKNGFTKGHLDAMTWVAMVMMGGAVAIGIKDILSGRDPIGDYSSPDRLWRLAKYSGIVGYLPELLDTGVLPPISSGFNLITAKNFYEGAGAVMSGLPGQNLPVINEAKHAIMGMIFEDWYGVHYQNRLDYIEEEAGQSSIYQKR